ncbi:MAG: isoleucine--tRNA ligase [Chlamydiales bacterium]
MSQFEEIPKETVDERESKVLKFWEENHIFEKSLKQRENSAPFRTYDGPPFATGLPHYGHLLAGTIKDVIPRYKTMKGYFVERRFGWDCHGLPIENEIEKANNLSGAHEIEGFGIAKFNEECRDIVLRYTKEWKVTVKRMARWVDMENPYLTMDKSYMESVWWVFKQLYDKGLVYEGFKVMPFSAKLGTPLSNFEAGENYKEVDDPSLTVAFRSLNDPQTYFLAWTTTPWTLISNLALMVGEDIEYSTVFDRETEKRYILASERVSIYFSDTERYEIEGTQSGESLKGQRYEPLLPYFKEKAQEGAFRIITVNDSISTDEGTGIVHTAPAFGEVDFYACRAEGIDIVCPVDNNGRFTHEVPEYQGQFVKDADKAIIRRLKQEEKVIRDERCHHRYPFCWRSDTPLIYKAVTTWFVAVEQVKDKLLKANEQIHWTPHYIKHGRFGKWLEGARDWAISRNRYWGTPIPLWRAEDGEILVIGSIAELEELTGKTVQDLHRHYIDDLVITRNGKTFERIPEVFDCWFESGSAPYARLHYPFENQETFAKQFPADFIAEGLDQTRGWFYTLTVLGAALFDGPAFKNVIVNGIILAEDGAKMSKRLKNYPDPAEVIHAYGADAIRLYMLDSPAARADDLRFSKKGVELVMRQVLIPLWNAYTFLVTYARIYDWKPDETKPQSVIDRWILSLLNKLILDVEEGLDDYDLSHAVKPFVNFVDQLTNWYIRRSRRRFWEDEDTPDRREAFATLYHVLITLSRIAAPFIPFITEMIYQNLKTDGMPESVHLTDFPHYLDEQRDEALEATMRAVQTAVSLGHSLRKEHKLKVRQPLPVAHVAETDEQLLHFLEGQKHLIAEELNVKNVKFSTDEKQFVSLKAKPNFRILGKKVGKKMPAVQEHIVSLGQDKLSILMQGESIDISVEGETMTLDAEDVEVTREVKEGMIAANLGTITVALETELSDELIKEGLARELVNKINTMRREAQFEITDRIHVKIATTELVKKSYQEYDSYVQNEVLAISWSFEPCEGTEWDLNGEPATIEIRKA